MTNKVTKPLNSGEQLTVTSIDGRIISDEIKTVTRNNRSKEYRDLWIRVKDTGEERLIHLYPGDESFRYTIGQQVRLVYVDWDKSGLEKSLHGFVKKQAENLEGIDGRNFQLQALKNLTTGQVLKRGNLYTREKFPFAWTISAAMGIGFMILYTLLFGSGGHKNEVVGWVGFWSLVIIRVGIAVLKFKKYGDASGKIDSAVAELFSRPEDQVAV
jgi:hypothetical protein